MKYLIINVMVIRKRSSAWVLLWSVLIFFMTKLSRQNNIGNPCKERSGGCFDKKYTTQAGGMAELEKAIWFAQTQISFSTSHQRHKNYNTPWCVLKTQSLWNSAGQFLLWFLVCTAQKLETSDLRKMAQQIFSTVFATLRKVWIQHITMVGVWNGVNLCSLHTS